MSCRASMAARPSSLGSVEVATAMRSSRRARASRSIWRRIIGAPARSAITLPGRRVEDMRACSTARIIAAILADSRASIHPGVLVWALHPLQLEDLVGLHAGGGVDLHHVADFLADHAAG